MLRPIILCGGTGTRLWPKSTKDKPKQFIKILDSQTLLEKTIDRVSIFGKPLLLINEKHSSFISENYDIMEEPESRDTCPAMIISALKFNEDDILLVVPSDHFIPDEKIFKDTIERGIEAARNGFIVTFGIEPTRPETGYGYIERSDGNVYGAFKVLKFLEKPDLQTAINFVQSGSYLWNSGIFLYSAGSFLRECEKYCLDILQICKDSFVDGRITSNYAKVPRKSIDYAVMEKSDKIAVVPSNMIWDDVGNYNSILKHSKRCKNGNSGNAIFVESNNCLGDGSEKQVVVFGCDNMAIIETNDIICVFPLARSHDIKTLLSSIPDHLQ